MKRFVEGFGSCKETYTKEIRCLLSIKHHIRPSSLRCIAILVILRTYLDRLEGEVLIVWWS
jgi:hypothetical protein